MFISDEVITGFGRTGSMFGARGWDTKPDIMCLAKGLSGVYIPFGATMFNDCMDEAFRNNADGMGNIAHGYTYSGHPLGCAAALASIDIVEKENIPENAAIQGTYLLEKCKTFVDRFDGVGNVRGKGLMMAIELVSDKATKKPAGKPYVGAVYQKVLDNGAIVRTSGNKVIVSPPLVITRKDVDVIYNALETAFMEVKG